MKDFIETAVKELAKRKKDPRKLFYSEADFQHELALQIKEMKPRWKVRLEYPVKLRQSENSAIDLFLKNGNKEIGIELKYLTAKLKYKKDGEEYNLKEQSAHDIRLYDAINDIVRMEKFVREPTKRTARVIVLTNDKIYWTGPTRENTKYEEFSLKPDKKGKVKLAGTRSWKNNPSKGTIKGRKEELKLQGEHSAKWQEFSSLKGKRNGDFKFISFSIKPNK